MRTTHDFLVSICKGIREEGQLELSGASDIIGTCKYGHRDTDFCQIIQLTSILDVNFRDKFGDGVRLRDLDVPLELVNRRILLDVGVIVHAYLVKEWIRIGRIW